MIVLDRQGLSDFQIESKVIKKKKKNVKNMFEKSASMFNMMIMKCAGRVFVQNLVANNAL